MSLGDLQTTLLKKIRLAPNVFAFTFKKSFDFIPGQYITMFLGTDSRDFTIASSPLEDDFTIVTKSGISDFKNRLFRLPVGSLVSIKLPAGGFTLKDMVSPKVFLAGGIGITPFYSMITHISENKLTTSLTLFVSFSKKSDIIFYDELHNIASKNPNIKIIYSLSNDTWEGEVGRISEDLIRKYVPNLEVSKFFIAGGEEMTYNTEELLLKMGIDSSRIRLDIFTGY